MLVNLVIFTVSFHAVCLFDGCLFLFVCLAFDSYIVIIYANCFCFHALSLFLLNEFVYLNQYFALCTVLLISWFS